MKGYRFYIEYENGAAKRRRAGTGNVLAVMLDERGRPLSWGVPGIVSCFAAVLSQPDSPVCGCGVHVDVLRRNYRRTDERTARKVHPAMFRHLARVEDVGGAP